MQEEHNNTTPMRLKLILILLVTIIFKLNIYDSQIIVNEIQNEKISLYYDPPVFDVKNTNVTFGGSIYSKADNPREPLLKVAETISMICQADNINKKISPFTIDGILNLVFQEYESKPSSGQGAIMTLLQGNLKGTDSDKLNIKFQVNLTGILGSADSGSASVNNLASDDFGIPFVDADDFAVARDSLLSTTLEAENMTFFQISDSYEYNTFTAIMDIATFFNWTLLGSIFEANYYGYDHQKDVIYRSFTNSTPIFACNYLYYFDNPDSGMISANINSLSDYCRCIKDKDKMSITILWMEETSAAAVIKNIREVCSGTESWTYLVAGDFVSTTPYIAEKSGQYLENALLLRNFGPWDYASFISKCLETASPEAAKNVLPLLDKYTLYAYNCQLNRQDGMKECGPLIERDYNAEPCHCSIAVFDEDPYTVNNFASVLHNL